MAIGQTHATLIHAIFARLQNEKPERLPSAGVLADQLRANIKSKGNQFSLKPTEACLFGSAAVEMWLRGVHSFLISNSLLKASPVWASTTGYYSSHYVMRALSHLLGHFLLGRDCRTVQMQLDNGKYVCDVAAPKSNLTEHQYYWQLPKQEIGSAIDTLFSDNRRIKDERKEVSDGFHRIYANYFDHVYNFPDFEPLDDKYLRARIDRLSQLATDALKVPDHKKFPDLDTVHIIAYARLVLFRRCLDTVVGTEHKYWRYFRNPHWFTKYMHFQIPDGAITAMLSDALKH